MQEEEELISEGRATGVSDYAQWLIGSWVKEWDTFQTRLVTCLGFGHMADLSDHKCYGIKDINADETIKIFIFSQSGVDGNQLEKDCPVIHS